MVSITTTIAEAIARSTHTAVTKRDSMFVLIVKSEIKCVVIFRETKVAGIFVGRVP